MILEISLATLLGIIIGVITGLSPGLHINLVSTIVASSALSINPVALACFIASLAITHTTIDFIPSIFLGAPEEDTFLAVLPGHKMLQQGEGFEATTIAMFGVFIGTLLSILTTPILLFLAKIAESKITELIPWILIAICLYLILRESSPLKALVFFTLAGFLGFTTTNLPLSEPLLPLLSGLFGASSLIISIKNKFSIPPQKIPKIKELKINKKEFLKTLTSAIIVSPIFSFLPALGSSYGSFMASELSSLTKKSFLFLNGLMNSIIMVSSISLVAKIGKARTGAAAQISILLQESLLEKLPIIFFCIIISAIISLLIGIFLAKKASMILSKINYTFLSILVIALMIALILKFSGLLGILVFATATSIGICTILSGIKRTNLMGSLLIPTIIFYLA
ncbi:MAG: tripartite tricarboxylate transporter permease [Nanoarchaeota archaeon]